ncbi:MAG: hypothetical protein ACQETB_02205 [Halobacteriota archaeon]
MSPKLTGGDGADTAPPFDGTTVRFDRVGSDRLEVADVVERRQYTLSLAEGFDSTPVSSDRFRFPVDGAVRVRTDTISLPTVVSVIVRDSAGRMLTQTDHFAMEAFPRDAYSIELCAPVKLYLRVDAQLEIYSDSTETVVSFGSPAHVDVGARSKHDRPAATVTTTSAPRDMMAAISTFGSALKTLSPERSYPTLRGHPPTIDLGEKLSIPSGIESPRTGIRIELPPTYRYIFVAAPLAYYLGADLVPAETPRLVTDRGFEYDLGSGIGFEASIEQLLKQTFLLDCVTRTEGLYPVDLYERSAIDSAAELNIAALYDATPADRLEAYLSVDYEDIEPYVPEWKLTTHVTPTPDSVEMIPFLVNDLAIVRTPSASPKGAPAETEAAIGDFLRDRSVPAGEFVRSSEGTTSIDTSNAYVQPERTESLEQAWVGTETPIGASKPTTTAYHNRLDRRLLEGDISITVVCNDPKMEAERGVIDETYGSREELPFDVTVHHDLTTDQLRQVIRSEAEFFHYIGHIDPEGVRCVDGTLDLSSIDATGIDAFLLNACQSYEQGMALIDAGAIGGIATLANVVNDGAVRVGSTIAKLLNAGFPLRPALEIAKTETISGHDYIVIGDGGLTITQPESGAPILCDLSIDGDRYVLEPISYPTTTDGLGSIVVPRVKMNQQYYLNSGRIGEFELSADEADRFLSPENIPVRYNGSIYWSTHLDSVESLRDLR